eukprot:Rhum_TRINITY_DN1254_c0_g2::Rhum_TRINITY_DN1254_c0_g2_i1::g.3727::m.3727
MSDAGASDDFLDGTTTELAHLALSSNSVANDDDTKRQVSFARIPSQGELSAYSSRTSPGELQRSQNSMTRSLAIMAITNKSTPESGAAKAIFKLKGLVGKRRAAQKRMEEVDEENSRSKGIADKLYEVQEDVGRSISLRRSGSLSALRDSRSSVGGSDSGQSLPHAADDPLEEIENLRRELHDREHQIFCVSEIGQKLEKDYQERGRRVNELLEEQAQLNEEVDEMERTNVVLQREVHEVGMQNKKLRTEVLMFAQVQEDVLQLQDALEEKEAELAKMRARVQSERNDQWAGSMLNNALKRAKQQEKKLEEDKLAVIEKAKNIEEEVKEKAKQASAEQVKKANRMKDMAIAAFKHSQKEAAERKEKEWVKKTEDLQMLLEGKEKELAEGERAMQTLNKRIEDMQAEVIDRNEQVALVQRQLKDEAGKHLEARVAELTAVIQAHESDLKRTQASLQAATEQASTEEFRTHELQQENAALAAALERAQHEAAANQTVADTKVAAAAEREETLNAQAADLQRQLSAAEGQMRERQRQHTGETSSLDDRALDLTRQLDAAQRRREEAEADAA